MVNHINSLKTEQESLAKDVQTKRAQLVEISSKFQSCEEHNLKLQETVKMLEVQNANVIKDLERRSSEASEMKRTIGASLSQERQLEEDLAKSRSHVSELEATLRHGDKERKNMHDKKAQLEEKIRQHTAKNTVYDLSHRLNINSKKLFISDCVATCAEPYNDNATQLLSDDISSFVSTNVSMLVKASRLTLKDWKGTTPTVVKKRTDF